MLMLMAINVLSVFFFMSNAPMVMAAIIVLSALNSCLLMFSLFYSSWLSYILFLVFLGGVMVIFIYMCSIASNEMVEISLNKVFFFMVSGTLVMILMSYTSEKPITSFISMVDGVMVMYSELTWLVLATTFSYLLITLLVCVSVTKMKFGPMRTKKS